MLARDMLTLRLAHLPFLQGKNMLSQLHAKRTPSVPLVHSMRSIDSICSLYSMPSIDSISSFYSMRFVYYYLRSTHFVCSVYFVVCFHSMLSIRSVRQVFVARLGH